MRILLFGSGDFGLPLLEKLADRGDEITLVTIPPRRQGRGRKEKPNSLTESAERRGIKVLAQDNIKDQVFIDLLGSLKPEVQIVVDYGKIVPPAIIRLASVRSVNVHPSLLPKYRGASPIQSCLLNDDKETGVTIQLLSDRLDAGDILLAGRIVVSENDDYQTLFPKLQAAAVPLVEMVLDSGDTLRPEPQDEAKATYCRKLGKEVYTTGWNEPAVDIRNRMRAVYPVGIRTMFRDSLVKLLKAEAVADRLEWAVPPGTVCEAGKDGLVIRTSVGGLKVLELQPENRNRIQAKDFLNGYRPAKGEMFRSSPC